MVHVRFNGFFYKAKSGKFFQGFNWNAFKKGITVYTDVLECFCFDSIDTDGNVLLDFTPDSGKEVNIFNRLFTCIE